MARMASRSSVDGRGPSGHGRDVRRRRAALAILLILIGICAGPAYATTPTACDDVVELAIDDVQPCVVCEPQPIAAVVEIEVIARPLVESERVIVWAPKTSPPGRDGIRSSRL